MIPLPVFVDLTHTSGRKMRLRSDCIVRVEEPVTRVSEDHKAVVVMCYGDTTENLSVRESIEEYWSALKNAITRSVDECVAETPKDRKKYEDTMEVVPNIHNQYQSRRNVPDSRQEQEKWFEEMDVLMAKLAKVWDVPFLPVHREVQGWED